MEQTTIQQQERSERPSRHVPRNFENSENPVADQMDYRNRQMEEALGIDFINSSKDQEEEETVLEELGVDEL